jgi:hypothetical protein
MTYISTDCWHVPNYMDLICNFHYLLFKIIKSRVIYIEQEQLFVPHYLVAVYISHVLFNQGPSWSWSYGSWIYNYLCNQCLPPQKLWIRIPFMARCTLYNIMWYSLSVTCNRSVVFSGHSGFLHQSNWPPRYNWNTVEVVLNTTTLTILLYLSVL